MQQQNNLFLTSNWFVYVSILVLENHSYFNRFTQIFTRFCFFISKKRPFVDDSLCFYHENPYDLYNVRPPTTIAFSWGELITPISRTGLWYANNELVTGAFMLTNKPCLGKLCNITIFNGKIHYFHGNFLML